MMSPTDDWTIQMKRKGSKAHDVCLAVGREWQLTDSSYLRTDQVIIQPFSSH